MQAALMSKVFGNIYLKSTKKNDDDEVEAKDEVKEENDNPSDWWFSSFMV